jgi:hypothetical protein
VRAQIVSFTIVTVDVVAFTDVIGYCSLDFALFFAAVVIIVWDEWVAPSTENILK